MTKKKDRPPKSAKLKKTQHSAPLNADRQIGLRRLLAVAIALFAFLLYSNTLSHEFALDDHSVIKENYVIKSGLNAIPTILTTNYRYGYWNSKGALYRPVSLIMFAAEWQLAPDTPAVHHFVNVLLYAITGFVLFMLLSGILRSYHLLIPLIASVLFIAHPVHTEVVANIKSRDEILAFLFCLGAIHFLWNYLKQRQLVSLLASAAFYTLALYSKESVITFLAVFPLLMYFFSKRPLPEIAKTSAIYLIPVVLYFVVRASVLGDVAAGAGDASVLDSVLSGSDSWAAQKATAILLMGKYLLTMIFPHPLGSDFGYNQIPITSWSDWRVLLSLAVHSALLWYALKNIKRKDLIAFGILFYFITFSIFSNLIINIGSSFGERFLYISSLGLCLSASVLLFRLFKINTSKTTVNSAAQLLKTNTAMLSVAGLLVLLFSIKTFTRNPAWYNSYTLYSTDIKVAPNSAKLQYHYGLETMKAGLDLPTAQKEANIRTAIDAFEKSIAIYPEYHDAYSQMGLAYFRLNELGTALQNYEKSLKLKPDNAMVYSNMGIIYFQNNDLQKAREVYEKAVELDPRFVDARRNLGAVYAGMRMYDQAIHQWEEGLKYEPNNATLLQYIGTAYRDKGDTEKANQYLERAAATGNK